MVIPAALRLCGHLRTALRWVGVLSSRAVVRFPRPRHFAWLVRSRETNWTFTLVLSVLYLVYLIWGHSHHELWRDEIHPWVLARQAEGFWDLVTGDRLYDGHPPGWFWYLRVFTWGTRDVWGLHVATIAASACAGLLFLRYGPFPRILRVALLCSYLLGYEYGIMSRNYSLGVLATFGFCALVHPHKPRPILLSLLLGVLALSSAYGAIIAACLFLVVVAESSSLRKSRLLTLSVEPGVLIGAGLVALAIGFAFYSSSPPDPNPYAPGWNFQTLNEAGFRATRERMVYAFLPVRDLDQPRAFWHAAEQYWKDHAEALSTASWAVPLVALVVFIPSWVELSAFALGTTFMGFIQLARYGGSVRHWGHFFVLFLALCWTKRARLPAANSAITLTALFVVAAFQLGAFLVAVNADRTLIFAGGGDIARRIQAAKLQDLPIVAGPDWAAVSVTGVLDRNFFSCETDEINQTLVFHARRRPCSPTGLVRKAMAVAAERKQPVLLLSLSPLVKPAAAARFEVLFNSGRQVLDENFYVYKLTPQP